MSDPSTRGVGRAETSVTSNGQQQTADVVLMPQGTLIVAVNDSNGQPVAGATVSVASMNGTFRGGGSGITGADGRVVVLHVLAGAFTVEAASGGLSGSATGTLAGDTTVSVTVQLQPVASVAGVVYLPNGQTPAAGRIDLWNGVSIQTAILAADGSYRFDGLPLGQFQLKAYDSGGQLRAQALWFSLTTPAQVVTRNLTFVGLGTVSGRVLNIDSSSAGNTSVQIQSLNAAFGGYRSTRTDAAGYYQVTGVPVGRVAVLAGDVSQGIFAEASGNLATDGQDLVVDLLLKNNSTYFPVSLYDANGLGYFVDQAGTVRSSDGYDFSANGGLKLEIETGGVTTAFAGSGVGTLEAGGRQVVARQLSLAGLDVTRRVFVPSDGYFARFVDVLTNPGTSPVTVNLWMTSYTTLSSLITTSSGDTTIRRGRRGHGRPLVHDRQLDGRLVHYAGARVRFRRPRRGGPRVGRRVRALELRLLALGQRDGSGWWKRGVHALRGAAGDARRRPGRRRTPGAAATRVIGQPPAGRTGRHSELRGTG